MNRIERDALEHARKAVNLSLPIRTSPMPNHASGMHPDPIRTTKEYFVSDDDIKQLMGLFKHHLIVDIKRRSFAWGKDKRATLDNLGWVVVVVE